MSGIFKSTTIKGTRITDFSNTSASVGDPLPFGYGKFPVDGKVIWAPLPPVEHVKRTRQGKGGVKQETYTYTLDYAIAFCRGPIYGFVWIKRNGKVVYTTDPNAPVEDKAYAAKWLNKATLYYGTTDQLPDSTIESHEGSGQVSAFRRLAYLVVEDDDVTEQGGAVPSYEAVVIASPPEIYVTSRPYRLEDKTAFEPGLGPTRGYFLAPPIEPFDLALAPLTGSQREIIQTFSTSESFDLGLSPRPGELREVLQRFSTGGNEFDVSTLSPLSGTLVVTLYRYQNWPAEPFDVSLSPLTGSLS